MARAGSALAIPATTPSSTSPNSSACKRNSATLKWPNASVRDAEELLGGSVRRALLHEAVLGSASQLLLGSTRCTIVSGVNVGRGKCDEHQSDQFLHWMSPWLVEIPRYYRSIMRHRQA